MPPPEYVFSRDYLDNNGIVTDSSRRLVFVLSDEEIEIILSKLFELVEPGDDLQWGEVDIHTLRIDKINGECSTAALEGIVRITCSADPRLVPHWVPELPRLFESVWLENAKKDTRVGPRLITFMFHECMLMVHDMIARKTRTEAVGRLLKEILPEVPK
ncbi:hypothetical protein BO83DRAFT_440313 [Aspergillus eucalypticola CBS 122712]|uniref:Uncharacterized protein n=1 Tax=Aspergillus eucalypticola (strain CBS 122712 / IBT 29274) TaxID=1448314 RepID=A0A317UY85_ASPEC|nr:uncharacterized protein BO83DRAFT_440313 [Aspergillus eucalypticola CBS 122712]PWY65497.1 hypothetical protein BO83DRAFT_440313 [Aspergillus eucalypticola CBS 122712]